MMARLACAQRLHFKDNVACLWGWGEGVWDPQRTPAPDLERPSVDI